ncbi:MAG: hypothetical protein U9R60_09325 [Bacteroidota bacterium]|nr:hypothetical protein [Bacteroidota bacterium]
MIIFTRVPIDNFDNQEDDINYKYPGASLVAVDLNKPDKSEIILTTDFYSACSPSISYDAKHILFIAQQNENDSWQVWEMDLRKRTSKKITDFEESCSGPAYLPGDRLVFGRQIRGTGTGSDIALFTMNLDGSNISQITFHPHYDYPSTILRDGRILILTKQLYPISGDMMYLAMRPNGTKAELFFKGEDSCFLDNQAYETMDGLVYFIEWEQGKDRQGDLVSVHQNRPLFTKINYTSEIAGGFYSVFPMQSGDMIVSYRPSENDPIALYRFSVQEKSLSETIFSYSNYHMLEPVMIEAYTRPRNLPDEVNRKESTGLLFCQDINVTAAQHDTNLSFSSTATKVEILGIDKSFGIVPVEEDGSFYLKVIADTPVRLQTLDENGNILNGPSGWIWLRPFERRGCVGCHEDPELAPKNFVPLSVTKPPVSIPVESSQESEPASTTKIAE